MCSQGVLIHMFRELIDYCVTACASSGIYSLSLERTPTNDPVIFSFWSGNVPHRVCLCTGPRGLPIPKKVLGFVSSFITLFESPPNCVCLVGMGDKLNQCFTSALPGTKRPNLAHSFGPADFEKCLTAPPVNIIERHDFRPILDFLFMKLRTALDRDWLQSLPLLHKVFSFHLLFHSQLHLSLIIVVALSFSVF